MKRTLAVAAFFAAQIMSGAAADTASNQADVVAAYVRERDFSGVVRVTQHGKVVLEKTYGKASLAYDVDNRADTRFAIASISKAFVATAVLQLADAKKLDLDAPIGKWLKGLPPELSARTARQLLDHTAGLVRESDFSPWETLTLEQHVARIAAIIPGKPGTYNYSNSGYVLLGRLVEIASGEAYADYVTRHIILPAGLKDTGFIVGFAVIPTLAAPYRITPSGVESTWRARQLGIYPPGGLYSSAADLAKFLSAIENGTVLSPKRAAEMLSPHAQEGPEKFAGYGLDITVHEGIKYIVASGSAEGGKTVIMRDPADDTTIVILSNFGETPVMEMLRDLVKTKQGVAVPPPAPCRVPGIAAFDAALGSYDFAGTDLAHEMGGTLKMALVRSGSRLFLWEDDGAMLLCEKAPGVLGLPSTNEISLRFDQPKGKPPVMIFTQDGKESRAARQN
jgi:CubicO group peptidase (beta-lactamase class C family)